MSNLLSLYFKETDTKKPQYIKAYHSFNILSSTTYNTDLRSTEVRQMYTMSEL